MVGAPRARGTFREPAAGWPAASAPTAGWISTTVVTMANRVMTIDGR
ncbi:MAG TPA: hypothetical protein VMV92_14365 [Streptosporangiaceae bacterium]|nr:hypothetical protein [Streptosporangiaceae bacterium]